MKRDKRLRWGFWLVHVPVPTSWRWMKFTETVSVGQHKNERWSENTWEYKLIHHFGAMRVKTPAFILLKTFKNINYSTSFALLCRWSNNRTRTAIFKAEMKWILKVCHFILYECLISKPIKKLYKIFYYTIIVWRLVYLCRVIVTCSVHKRECFDSWTLCNSMFMIIHNLF